MLLPWSGLRSTTGTCTRPRRSLQLSLSWKTCVRSISRGTAALVATVARVKAPSTFALLICSSDGLQGRPLWHRVRRARTGAERRAAGAGGRASPAGAGEEAPERAAEEAWFQDWAGHLLTGTLHFITSLPVCVSNGISMSSIEGRFCIHPALLELVSTEDVSRLVRRRTGGGGKAEGARGAL